MGLYVETRIHADLEELWTRTQTPRDHARWDLRFSEITYLRGTGPGSTDPGSTDPGSTGLGNTDLRDTELGSTGPGGTGPGSTDLGGTDLGGMSLGGAERFRYASRVVPGVVIAGVGVSAGERRRPDGTRTSALRFASDDPRSLIAEGRGYWRYVPDGDAVRFLTGYDYRPRWGWFGAVADRLVFRPLMGWATAWSFDRLRLWLERGISPEAARRRWLTELAVRTCALAAALTGAAALPHPLYTLPAALAALLLPPLPTTPAARRCRRTPPPRTHTPHLLTTLPPVTPAVAPPAGTARPTTTPPPPAAAPPATRPPLTAAASLASATLPATTAPSAAAAPPGPSGAARDLGGPV